MTIYTSWESAPLFIRIKQQSLCKTVHFFRVSTLRTKLDQMFIPQKQEYVASNYTCGGKECKNSPKVRPVLWLYCKQCVKSFFHQTWMCNMDLLYHGLTISWLLFLPFWFWNLCMTFIDYKKKLRAMATTFIYPLFIFIFIFLPEVSCFVWRE